jgi:hypothetical protein
MNARTYRLNILRPANLALMLCILMLLVSIAINLGTWWWMASTTAGIHGWQPLVAAHVLGLATYLTPWLLAIRWRLL